MAPTRKLVNLVFAVVLILTLFAGVAPPVLADQDSSEGSFWAYVFKDGEWQLQGVLHFSDYETLQMQLSNHPGQLKLRLVQEGHDGAYIDQVIVQKDGISYLPVSAVNIDSKTDVLTKILYPEYDVCNGWDSMLEIVWDNAPENATLVMRAMEEDLGEGHGAPMYYPWPWEHRTLSYLLVSDGGITVDGVLEESTGPDFSVFWQPYTPHPDGYTYGWVHCDNKYLYAAVEVTGDNTADEGDWGALYIIVNGKQKEFRVSNDQIWGIRGFQYTSSVPYEHRIYEFKIPLNEINAVVGSEIHYIFGAYGTFASVPLTFDTVPANTGSIVFDGSTYYDGDVYPLGWIGPYNIEAKPAPGYVFVEWQVEGSISVDDPYSYVAHLSVTDINIGINPSTLRMVQTVFLPTAPRVSPSLPRQLSPAQMSLQYLNVSPQQASANQPVTITTNVVNTGDEAGSLNVALKINGQIEQQKMVSVGPQGTQPVKFAVSRSQPGTYSVDIGGQKGSFTISGTESKPVNVGMVVLIAMAVLILATVVVLMISFRRSA